MSSFGRDVIKALIFIVQVVPFRLTQNMVQGMGPTGYEGPFRISCEAALGLMRKQKNILMSSLRPFVFDPLVSYG